MRSINRIPFTTFFSVKIAFFIKTLINIKIVIQKQHYITKNNEENVEKKKCLTGRMIVIQTLWMKNFPEVKFIKTDSSNIRKLKTSRKLQISKLSDIQD